MALKSSTYTWLFCIMVGVVIGILMALAPPKSTDSPSVAGTAIGGAFALTDQNGKKVTDQSWPGQYLLVYFGFTHCADICPIGLGKMTEALDNLPKEVADKIQPIFITVDPERDTVEELKNYVAVFHPRLTGLTGTTDDIEKVIKLYRVYAQKQGAGKDYMINHSGFMYLMSPTGENSAIFAHETTADDMAKAMEKIIRP